VVVERRQPEQHLEETAALAAEVLLERLELEHQVKEVTVAQVQVTRAVEVAVHLPQAKRLQVQTKAVMEETEPHHRLQAQA
jgi:hypothetical protein